MTQPEEMYRNVPRLRSTPALDRAVLAEAQRRTDQLTANRDRRYFAPALATLAVAVIGVTLVLRTGVPPVATNDTNEVPEKLSRVELAQQVAVAPMASQDVAGATIETESAETSLSRGEPPEVRLNVVRQKSAIRQDAIAESGMQEMADALTASDVAPSFDRAAPTARMIGEQVILNEQVQSAGVLRIAEQPRQYFTVFIQNTDERLLSELTIPVAIVELRSERTKQASVIGSFKSRQLALDAIGQLDVPHLQPKVLTFEELELLLR